MGIEDGILYSKKVCHISSSLIEDSQFRHHQMKISKKKVTNRGIKLITKSYQDILFHC